MNVMLLYSDLGHVLATHVAGHLQHGKSKSINMFIICQDHSTVQNHIVMVTVPVKR